MSQSIKTGKITAAAVKQAAGLAKIEINEQELPSYLEKLAQIVELQAELSALELEPAPAYDLVFQDKLRLFSDQIADGAMREDILKNAINFCNYFTIPKVIERDE